MLIKNVVITKSPHLRRVETFIQKTWTNLEYIELTHLGDTFGRSVSIVINSIFKAPKPQVSVQKIYLEWVSVIIRKVVNIVYNKSVGP